MISQVWELWASWIEKTLSWADLGTNLGSTTL